MYHNLPKILSSVDTIEAVVKSGGIRCHECIDKRKQVIRSPGYPQNYDNYLDCQWVLKAPAGKKFKIHFDTFETENCHDGMSIYDGDTIKWWSPQELRANLCGSSIPGDVQSTGNTILIRFSSDETVSDRGFKLTYSLV